MFVEAEAESSQGQVKSRVCGRLLRAIQSTFHRIYARASGVLHAY